MFALDLFGNVLFRFLLQWQITIVAIPGIESCAEVVVGRPCEEPSQAPHDAIAKGHPHDAKMQV